jgi:hypothetical protein
MRFYEVAVEIEGRRYAGTWSLRQGGVIRVGCAWGSEAAEIGRANPGLIAARTLAKIVKADQKRRAKESAQFELARARVRGKQHRPYDPG